MQIDKSISAQGGGLHEKNYTLDVSDSSNYVGVPWLAVTFIKGDGGMAVCFILFFAVNPIYAICSGAYAGKDIKIFWSLPIITALFFLLGTWLFFSIGEKAFILYAFGYLLLGIVAELISMFVKKKILRG